MAMRATINGKLIFKVQRHDLSLDDVVGRGALGDVYP